MSTQNSQGALAQPAQVIIDTHPMQDYRILHVNSMSRISRALGNLVLMLREHEEKGTPLSAGQLEQIRANLAHAVMFTDFAHYFLIAHGQSLYENEKCEQAYPEILKKISNRPLSTYC